jgi:hypothetical protein
VNLAPKVGRFGGAAGPSEKTYVYGPKNLSPLK